ncbi:MAG: D-glycero-beta-D-manno-heptose 1-phosphate adenylyltransferase [Candidatus Omnitrophota bacterium]|nr:D-glycero-beta-D-manno-heptose 1-phosphate adenylyltransferase [Candidatus Omnitrophota bacterium]
MKIKTQGALQREINRLKRQGQKIVFTNGCFDLLHYGHAKYLQDAKNKGDILVVAVNSDSSIRKIKGKNRPIVDERNRLKLLSALASVDYLTLFKEATPLEVIKKIKPDILIKGADWEKSKIIGSGFVESYGGKVITIKLVKGLSTTSLVKKIVNSR